MGQDNLEKHRRYMAMAYMFMFLALFSVVSAVIAYLLARKVAQVDAEVWMHAQALWVMRNVIIFVILAAFAALGLFRLFSFIGIACFGLRLVQLLVSYLVPLHGCFYSMRGLKVLANISIRKPHFKNIIVITCKMDKVSPSYSQLSFI